MEIERKWLISPSAIPYDLSQLDYLDIEQAYISYSPVVRVRKINNGEKYVLTIKRSTEYGGIASAESEFELDRNTFEFLYSNHAGNVISKRRYLHSLPNGLLEEIDIFSGDLEGLAYMEIEFPSLSDAESYPNPDWVISDVTNDPHYKNKSLAEFGLPYKSN